MYPNGAAGKKGLKAVSKRGTRNAGLSECEEGAMHSSQGGDKPLDPHIAELLRQKTLYQMQLELWNVYELSWKAFNRSDHLKAKAPIPPNCRTLTLHVHL